MRLTKRMYPCGAATMPYICYSAKIRPTDRKYSHVGTIQLVLHTQNDRQLYQLKLYDGIGEHVREYETNENIEPLEQLISNHVKQLAANMYEKRDQQQEDTP